MLRTSIVLFGVALALLGFIVFVERGSLSTTEREGRKGRVLEDFVRERVDHVEIQRKGMTTVLARVPENSDDPLEGGGFRVERPYAARADKESVDSLLGGLEWVEARRSLGVISEAERARFGLNAPRYRVSYLVGRQRAGFSIGSDAADGGGVYLQLNGSARVFVVGKNVVEALDHEPNDFHSKELHEGLSTYTLQSLSIADASQEWRVVVRDGLDWLTVPFTGLASAQSLSTLVDALDALRATRFVTDGASQLAEYGFSAPRLRVQVESKVFDKKAKGKQITEQLALSVGGACAGHAGESYLRVNQGAIFCVADSALEAVRKRPDDLRETHLLPLDDSSITGVHLTAGARELSLETVGKELRYRVLDRGKEQSSGVVDPVALSAWYKSLRELSSDHIEALDASAKTRLEAHAMVAIFQRGKDKSPYVVHLSEDATGASATRMDENSVLRLPARAGELLSIMGARFRKSRVLDQDETAFSQLTLGRPGAPLEIVQKSGASYQLVMPLRAAAQGSTLDDILRMVSKLDAVRFVADSARPEHGFAAPFRTLRITYRAIGKERQDRVHSLVLGAASGDDGRFARLDADPAVFVVSKALEEKLTDPLISRDAAALDLAQLVSFDLFVGAARTHVERQDAGFAITEPHSTDLTVAQVQAFASVLSSLHATRALDYGKPAAVSGLERPSLRVVAHLRDQRELTFEFGAETTAPHEDPQVFMRRSDLDATFLVPRAQVESLRALTAAAAKHPG
jgi:hypothetical protein